MNPWNVLSHMLLYINYLYTDQTLETNSLRREFYQKFTRKFEIYQAN